MGKRTTPKKPKASQVKTPTTTVGEQLVAAAVQAGPDAGNSSLVDMIVDSFSTPEIIRGVERTGANVHRFIPERLHLRESDGRILLGSARYAEWFSPDGQKIEAGIGIGPEKKRPGSVSGFAISKGGVIVPVHANEKFETIEPRIFRVPKKRDEVRRFVDYASFEMGPDGRAVAKPYNGEMAQYVEAWSGDASRKPRSATLQLIQSGLFEHGSVALTGGDLLVNAHNLREGRANGEMNVGPDVDQMPSKAELVGEVQGDWLAGYLLWINRMWRLRYSAKESEEVLVKHRGRYYVLYVKDGTVQYFEGTEAQYGKTFERLTVDQNLVPVQKTDKTKTKSKKAA